MERSRIFAIGAWGIAALFLGAVLAVGFATGGFGLGQLTRPAGEAPGEAEAWDTDYRYSWDVTEDPVTGLDISWFHGPIELKVGDGNLIYITEWSAGELEEEAKLELSSSGGVLTIKWNSQLLALDMLDTRSKSLAVQVPRQVVDQLEELRCTAVSGDVTAQGFSAGEMEIASDAGELALSDLKADRASFRASSGTLRLENARVAGELLAESGSGLLELWNVSAGEAALTSVSGDVYYQGEAAKFSAGTISGAVEAALGKAPDLARFSSVSGGLTLALPEDTGFEAAFSSVSGGFRSDFPVNGAAGASGRALYGDGRSKLEFATTSGQMVVAKG